VSLEASAVSSHYTMFLFLLTDDATHSLFRFGSMLYYILVAARLIVCRHVEESQWSKNRYPGFNFAITSLNVYADFSLAFRT